MAPNATPAKPALKKTPSTPSLKKKEVAFVAPLDLARLSHANAKCKYFVGSYRDMPQEWEGRRVKPMFTSNPPPFLPETDQKKYNDNHAKMIDGLNRPAGAPRGWNDKASNARVVLWQLWFASRDAHWPLAEAPWNTVMPNFDHNNIQRKYWEESKTGGPVALFDERISQRTNGTRSDWKALNGQNIDNYVYGGESGDQNVGNDDADEDMPDENDDNDETALVDTLSPRGIADESEEEWHEFEEDEDMGGVAAEAVSENGENSIDDGKHMDGECPRCGYTPVHGFTAVNHTVKPAPWVPHAIDK